MKLRDVLEMIRSSDGLPDMWSKWDNIYPNSVFKVDICFMSEEETWVRTYPEHPILIPWYDCEVYSFSPSEENTLEIWLRYEDYMPKLIARC